MNNLAIGLVLRFVLFIVVKCMELHVICLKLQ